jgi:D-glucuronyl C5-epimerase C-terminus
VPAAAAPVLVMREDGSVVRHRHSLTPAETFPPVRSAADQRRSKPAATLSQRRRTVPGELKRLLAAGAIDDATYAERHAAYDDAKRTVKSLRGRRKLELGAVVKTLEDIAARGQLSASRLAPLFLTLQRNREWWTNGPLLSSGRRVGFDGSQIVWQYYPGAGIQIQVLGTFGKVNALWSSRQNTALGQAVDELLPLAAERAGGLAWEYYFDYRAGKAPWVSSLAQGTALQALSRAAQRLRRQADVLPVTGRGLSIFEQPAPEGVRVPVGAGAHYAQYSFEPGLRILNGFIQSLVGLYDYGRIAADGRATALFAAGEARARQEVPTYDTGAWSLYSRGTVTHESDLGYHTLLRDFLRNLCDRTETVIYCDTAASFSRYLREPPELQLLTRRVRVRRQVLVRFEVSKVSQVGMTIRRDGTTVLSTSASVSRGAHAYAWTVPATPGTYDVVLAGTDLAGNFGRIAETIEVLGRRPRV